MRIKHMMILSALCLSMMATSCSSHSTETAPETTKKEVAIQLEGGVVHLENGGAGILQADHVGILGLQPGEQPALDCSLNTIHVHTDDPHKWPPKTHACMIPELTSFS